MREIHPFEERFVFSWLSYVVQMPFSGRQRRRAPEREGHTRQHFTDRFPGEQPVAGVVWDLLREKAVHPGFTPCPDDALLHLWGLAEEDLDDLVLEGLHRVGARIPSAEEIEGSPELVTVADLVAFLARFRSPESDPARSAPPIEA